MMKPKRRFRNPMVQLVRRRKALGMTQAHVAARCDKSRNWAYRLEHKRLDQLRTIDVCRYARAVGYKMVIEIIDGH